MTASYGLLMENASILAPLLKRSYFKFPIFKIPESNTKFGIDIELFDKVIVIFRTQYNKIRYLLLPINQILTFYPN